MAKLIKKSLERDRIEKHNQEIIPSLGKALIKTSKGDKNALDEWFQNEINWINQISQKTKKVYQKIVDMSIENLRTKRDDFLKNNQIVMNEIVIFRMQAEGFRQKISGAGDDLIALIDLADDLEISNQDDLDLVNEVRKIKQEATESYQSILEATQNAFAE